jgi:hypothetical protein
MDVVTTSPDGLDALTARINDAIERREHSKEEWAAATIQLCECLAEARSRFKNDKAFGEWFDASGFGLSHQDRAAAIAMGKEIELAREVLEKTDRRSLQHIHSKEFKRFTHVSKPPKPKKTNDKLEAALHVYDRRKLAGEELTYEAIAKEAGVSSTPVRRAIAIREAEEAAGKEEQAALSMSAKEKLEAAIRREIRRLELEAETKARQEARRIVDELSIPNYLETLKKVEGMLKWTRGVMPRSEYRKILACLHPDMARDGHAKRFEEAFRLFNQYEAKLVIDNEQADIKKVSTLPRTVEEMLARKQAKGAKA